MAFVATLQQTLVQSDQITVYVRYLDTATTPNRELVKSYQWTAGTIFASKAEFKAFVAGELTVLNSFGTKAAFLAGHEGQDISTL